MNSTKGTYSSDIPYINELIKRIKIASTGILIGVALIAVKKYTFLSIGFSGVRVQFIFCKVNTFFLKFKFIIIVEQGNVKRMV